MTEDLTSYPINYKLILGQVNWVTALRSMHREESPSSTEQGAG